MERRTFILSATAAIFTAAPLRAETVTESITRQLKGQGYKKISVSRTLLGRTRIVAHSKTRRREIILNPRTREILRDFWVKLSDDEIEEHLLEAEEEDGEGDDDGDDAGDDADDDTDDDADDHGDDHDDDHDDNGDEDDDNSGSGSSGSGGGDRDEEEDD